MSEVWVGLAAAVVCAVLALPMPRLVARLPEPEAVPEPAEGAELTYAQQLVRDEGPKVPFADLVREPGFVRNLVLIAAVAGGLMGWAVGWRPGLGLVLPWAPLGAALALVDLRTRLLPRELVWPLLGWVVLYGAALWAFDDARVPFVRGVVGLVIAWVLFGIFWFISPRGLGFGDVRLAAPMGFALAYLGFGQFLIGLYSPFLLFTLPALVLALVRWDRSMLKTAYPFGPALLAGLVLGVLVGAEPLHLVAG